MEITWEKIAVGALGVIYAIGGFFIKRQDERIITIEKSISDQAIEIAVEKRTVEIFGEQYIKDCGVNEKDHDELFSLTRQQGKNIAELTTSVKTLVKSLEHCKKRN